MKSKSKSKRQRYRIQWSIDIWEESPQAAAQQARRYQLSPEAICDFFTVTDSKGKETGVDLSNP